MRNIFFLLLFILLPLLFTGCKENSGIISYSSETQTNTTEKVPAEMTEQASVCVSIYGEVANPGIYVLKRGTRIYEAINQAGGVLAEADVTGLNLVDKLETDTGIFVPKMAEERGITAGTDSRININTATVETLTTLSGIGPQRAADIVDYREKNGGFQNIEDIMKVSGIGTVTFEKIRESIRVK